jgi:hypothetical protein
MEQSPWEATWFAANQEIPRIFGTRIRKCPPPVPILSRPHPNLMSLRIIPGPRHVIMFRNKASFYGEESLAPRPTPSMEDHPLTAVRDWLFNIFAATVHIGGCFSNCSPRTLHAVVTETPLSLHHTLNLEIVCSSQPPQNDVIHL